MSRSPLKLRISVDRAEGHVVFDALVPAADAPPVRVALGRYPLGEVGVPVRIDGSRRAETPAAPRLPPAFWSVVAGLGEPEAPLWLEFPDVGSYAMLLPWERALAPVRLGPVFRVPLGALWRRPLPLDPVIVVCISSPEAKGAVPIDARPLAEAISAAFPTGTMHWFVDRGEMREAARDLPNVHVHDSEPGTGWRSWIRQRVPSADVLHLVGHGVVSGDCGAIAVAWTPERNRTDRARCFDAAPISRLVDSLGASVVGIGAPQPNHSTLALRMLASDLGLGGARAVLLHEFERPEDHPQLTNALRAASGAEVPPLGDVALYLAPPSDPEPRPAPPPPAPQPSPGSGDMPAPAPWPAEQQQQPQRKYATKKAITQEMLDMTDPSEEALRALVDRLVQAEDE